MHMQYKRHKIGQQSLYQHISEPFHHVHVHKMFQENGKDGTFKHVRNTHAITCSLGYRWARITLYIMHHQQINVHLSEK